MASLQKKGESWYCQFMYQGQRHTYTVGKVEESEAQAVAARVDYLLMRIRQRLLEVPGGMGIVDFIEHDGKPPPASQPTPKSTPFSALRAAYLKTFGNGALESSTLRTAALHLQHLGKTLGEHFPMGTLALPDLQRHVDRRQKDVAGVTIKKEIDTLRAAWNWACRMRLTQGTFPNAGLVYPKGEDKLPFMTFDEIERRIEAGGDADELWECLYLTHTEIAELLDHVRGRKVSAWIYPAFVFTAHTGARRSEMMRARPEDVDLIGATVTIREKKRTRGKRTTRRVPLSARLSEALTAWLNKRRAGPFLFGPGARMLSTQTPQKAFHRAVRGSKWQVMRGWHVLRHSFISALASRGVDQRLIDDFVGHQTEEQRRRYRHLYPSTQAEAIKGVFG
jgi:integrase